MSEEGKSFEDFTAEFRLKVLALLFQKPEFLRLAAPTIRPEYFSSKIDETFAKIFIDFFKKYPASTITRTVIFEELNALIERKVFGKEELKDYINRFSDILSPIPDAEYIEENMGKFLETKAMEKALKASVDLLKKGKFDEIAETIISARSSTTAIMEIEEDCILSEGEEACAAHGDEVLLSKDDTRLVFEHMPKEL